MKYLDEFYFDLGHQVFSPNEQLIGYLYISFDRSLFLQNIRVTLIGEGRGKWLNQWKAANDITIDEKQKPLDLETILWSELFLFGDADGEPQRHEIGKFSYEFRFNLTDKIPISFRGPREFDLGAVKYHIEAAISRPNKPDVIIKKPISINPKIQEYDLCLAYKPIAQEVRRLNCCQGGGKGEIKIESSLKKGYFHQNELLVISNYVENNSKSNVTPFAKLVKQTKFKNKTFLEDIYEVTDEPLEPQSWCHWDEGEIYIPLIGPSSSVYKDIKVEYFIRTGVHRRYGSDVFVDLPIVIANADSETDGGSENEIVKSFHDQHSKFKSMIAERIE